jgi:hypothetical protein
MKPGAKFFAVLVLASLVRMLDYPSIFSPAGLCLAGGPDAYYQLRRAELAAEGTLASFDAWTNFPDGDHIHWPSPYAHLLGGALNGAGAFGLLIVPVLAGLAAIAVFSWLARRLAAGDSRTCSHEFATLAYAILPAAVYPTVFGAIDHHCLEGLLLLGAIAVAGSGRDDDRQGTLWRGVGGILVGGLGAAFITTWPIASAASAATTGVRLCRKPGALALILLAAALAVPVAGWSYFSTPWFAEIEEARPLIRNGRDFFKAVVMLSPGFALFPWAIFRWVRRHVAPAAESGAAAAALAATAVAIPLALLQARFLVVLAVPAALAIGEVAAAARQRYGVRPALFFMIVSLLPIGRGLAEIPMWKPDPLPGVHNALVFLRDKTPPAGEFLDPSTRPAYGVVAAWDLGHHILALGMRPAVANAFHTGVTGRDAADGILFSDTATATALADSVGARYLFLTNLVTGSYAREHRSENQPPTIEGLYGRLYLRGEAGIGWRLVYASHSGFTFEDTQVPWVQIWERDTLLNGVPPLSRTPTES